MEPAYLSVDWRRIDTAASRASSQPSFVPWAVEVDGKVLHADQIYLDLVSPREVARQAVSTFAQVLFDPSDKCLVGQLRLVRDTHALTRRKYFYAFVDEIDTRISLGQERLKLSSSDVGDVGSSPAPRSSLLSRLASFVGLSWGSARLQYVSLTSRELEWVWDEVVEELASARVVTHQELLQLLQDQLLKAMSAALSARRVSHLPPRSGALVRDRLLSFGLWTGTPPPDGVAVKQLSATSIRVRKPREGYYGTLWRCTN